MVILRKDSVLYYMNDNKETTYKFRSGYSLVLQDTQGGRYVVANITTDDISSIKKILKECLDSLKSFKNPKFPESIKLTLIGFPEEGVCGISRTKILEQIADSVCSKVKELSIYNISVAETGKESSNKEIEFTVDARSFEITASLNEFPGQFYRQFQMISSNSFNGTQLSQRFQMISPHDFNGMRPIGGRQIF